MKEQDAIVVGSKKQLQRGGGVLLGGDVGTGGLELGLGGVVLLGGLGGGVLLGGDGGTGVLELGLGGVVLLGGGIEVLELELGAEGGVGVPPLGESPSPSTKLMKRTLKSTRSRKQKELILEAILGSLRRGVVFESCFGCFGD